MEKNAENKKRKNIQKFISIIKKSSIRNNFSSIMSKSNIHTYKRIKLVELLIKSRKKSIDKIIYFFRNYKELGVLKKRILILRIVKLRNDSAIKIQKGWNEYKRYLGLHKLAHHTTGCYTIYSSIKNSTKIEIKIYTDRSNIDIYKIFSLRFCPIRKCFLIDIPKNKFPIKDRTIFFNFINQGKIYFEKSYDIVNYFGEKVHKINFDTVEQNNRKLISTIYSPESMQNYYSIFDSPKETRDIYQNDITSVSTFEGILSQDSNELNLKISNIKNSCKVIKNICFSTPKKLITNLSKRNKNISSFSPYFPDLLGPNKKIFKTSSMRKDSKRRFLRMRDTYKLNPILRNGPMNLNFSYSKLNIKKVRFNGATFIN